MRSRIVLAGVVAATTLTLLTGCTDAVGGRAQPVKSSGANSVGAGVDVAALDTGPYQTTPSAPLGAASNQQIVEYEGQRMAEFVVLPFEVDPELTDVSNPTEIIRSRANLVNVVGRGAAFVPANERFVAGFVSTASTPRLKTSDPNRAVNIMVVRYADRGTATAGARQMFDAYVAQNRAIPTALPGLPGSLVARTAARGTGALSPQPYTAAFTAHNDYVVFAWASSPARQEKWADDAVRTIVSRQVPLIDRFPATPTKAQNGGRPVNVAVDQNHILLYALPNPDANAANGSDRAVYGPRGMAHIATSPQTAFSTLTAAGAEHNAVWATEVYRAATGDGAQKIVTDLVNASLTAGFTRSSAPRGLPIASCLTRQTGTGEQNTCFVAVGRYVGESDDRDAAIAAQKISAQYLILARADQNAN